MIGLCVKTNGSFTLLEDYYLEFGNDFYSDKVTVVSDDGWNYIIEYQGDGYYGCIDVNGKEVSFLVDY